MLDFDSSASLPDDCDNPPRFNWLSGDDCAGWHLLDLDVPSETNVQPRRPYTGGAARRWRIHARAGAENRGLGHLPASQSTISRLENAPSKTEATQLAAALLDQFGTTVKPGEREILDIPT
jgi:hypothetical protein